MSGEFASRMPPEKSCDEQAVGAERHDPYGRFDRVDLKR